MSFEFTNAVETIFLERLTVSICCTLSQISMLSVIITVVLQLVSLHCPTLDVDLGLNAYAYTKSST